MYSSQEIAKRIKSTSKIKNESLGAMLSNLGMGINTVSELGKGKQISYLNFAKIADYLGVSVDYLLGRTENPNPQNINNSISATDINGDNVQSISSGVISQRDRELLDKINSLNFDDYADIISYINSKIKSAG